MYWLDLHTHSQASPDGGLTTADYKRMLERGQLDVIAVTDHGTIDFAKQLKAELGDAIIVGQEIRSRQGEIIGLYLHETIAAGQTAAETVAAIKAQGGLVYLPHPFETIRQGISEAVLPTIAEQVDLIETRNGRAVFQNRSGRARHFAVQYGWPAVAASDAHSPSGWGRTYTIVPSLPTRDTLVALLAEGTKTVRFPGIRAIAAPKLNRLKKKMHRDR